MNSTTVIIGANGFLGRYLCRHYAKLGKEVVAIARTKKGWSGDGMFLKWDGKSVDSWAYALEGAELVINLSGRSVNCRYSEENKQQILSSRITPTQVIGQAIASCRIPPKLWMNASTATWYRHAEDKPQNEWQGEAGKGFSYEVAEAWENAFFSVKVPAETRKIVLRIGMVLANEENTVFEKLTQLTRYGLGGNMGDGQQRVSWIHMEDFLRSIDFLTKNPFLEGIYNISSPDSPTNAELMKTFREVYQMPIGIHANRWMLEIGAAMMGTETELVLKSRWADPLRLREAGFRWRHPSVQDAVPDLQKRIGVDGFFHAPEKRSAGARAWLPVTTR